MLVQSKHLQGANILSLHTNQPISRLGEPIINPHNFGIAGFYCQLGSGRQEPLVLLTQDIRQVVNSGVLINSVDELTPANELIRLQETIKIGFSLMGKPVKTVSKRRLGKVDEYVVDTDNFLVQKIYVRQSLLKNMSLHSLVIDRSQILEVTDRQIIVSDATVAKPAAVPQQAT